MATSGDYRNFYIKDGKKYAHTINPANGYPAGQNILKRDHRGGRLYDSRRLRYDFHGFGSRESEATGTIHPQIEYFIIYADNNGQQKVTYSKGMLEYLPNRKHWLSSKILKFLHEALSKST